MNEAKHTLVLNQEHVIGSANDTWIAGHRQKSREEKLKARDAKMKQDAENARMASSIANKFLGEKAPEGGLFRSANLIASAPAWLLNRLQQQPKSRDGRLSFGRHRQPRF